MMSLPATFQRILRAFACLLAFAVCFVLACLAIRQCLPIPEVPAVQAKLEHLKRHVNEYDTLFIGSSRIYHQILPEMFDRLTAERGIPTKSFNSGVDGMRPPEDSYVFDQILSYRPQHLRWVFVELAGLRTSVDRDKRGTVRAVYWHDWPRLERLFWRALVSKKQKQRRWRERLEDLQEPMGEFSEHVALFARNMTNLGRGTLLTDWLTHPHPRQIYWKPIGDRRDGFIVTGRPEVMTEPDRVTFEATMAERKRNPAFKDFGDPVSQEALDDMVAKIRRLGATPVLIVPPTTTKKYFYPTDDKAGSLIILNFCDLEKYPELYENQYRLDTDHVNTAGAEVFTKLLVDRFAEAAQAKK